MVLWINSQCIRLGVWRFESHRRQNFILSLFTGRRGKRRKGGIKKTRTHKELVKSCRLVIDNWCAHFGVPKKDNFKGVTLFN